MLKNSFVLLLMLLSAAACSFGLPSASAPCSVTTSKQAADRLIQNIKTQSSKKNTTITITATSDEVSSLLAQALDQYKQNGQGNYIPLENAVVCFGDNKMTITGKVLLDKNNPLDALIVVTPAVTNGKADFTIDQIQLAGFPVPSEFNSQIAALINTALNQNLTSVTLSDIKIQNGQLSLTGKVTS
ncbi:MAG: hypothetical protein LC737_09805 [Chloroflexi bacterium]|nr:hypothetical protein [Chloroflexota bacterium]